MQNIDKENVIADNKIKFEKIEKIVKVVKSTSFMEEEELSIVQNLLSLGKIKHLRCYENTYWVAKELSCQFDGDWGVVEGYGVDEKPGKKGIKAPVWHVINYLKWDNEVRYFDITAETYEDQRYESFYAIRQYGISESEKIIMENGAPIPTHILCEDGRKLFYYTNNGDVVYSNTLRLNTSTCNPFFPKMVNVIYPKKLAQLCLDTLCYRMAPLIFRVPPERDRFNRENPHYHYDKECMANSA